MLTILSKLFIKNSDDVKNVKVREQYGVLTGAYGIFWNILLFAGKYFAGVITGSIAMTADAFNNLSDAGSSVISLVGFKLAGQKPDPQHPFGHGRLEYLTGLAVSALIVVMGYELTKDSILKIVNPVDVSFSWVAIFILLASILVKFYMSFYNRAIGKKIDSAALLATSTDSLSDTVSTAVVLLSSLAGHFFGIHIDGYCGVLVGFLIIFAGVKAAKETIDPLLGGPADSEFVKSIETIVLSHPEIVGIHDLIVHNYGPGRVMVTLHAEVPNIGDINVLHDVIDVAEFELMNRLNCHAVIHMDPVAVGDPEVDSLKEMIKGIILTIQDNLSIHDFRMVKGPTHTNLIFDTVVPFSVKMSDDEIIKMIQTEVSKKRQDCFCVITIDRDFTGK